MEKATLKAPPIWVQLILSCVLSALCALTVKTMWGWYIVPLGVPPIGFFHALGLDMTITFLVTTRPTTKIDFWEHFIWGTCYALLCLFMGWLIHFGV